MTGHRIGAWFKRAPWFRFCLRCGLVALNNDATRRATRRPCKGPEDA